MVIVVRDSGDTVTYLKIVNEKSDKLLDYGTAGSGNSPGLAGLSRIETMSVIT